MKVAVAGFSHETNSFAHRNVDMEILETAPLLRGDEIIDAHQGAMSPTAGFLEAAQDDGRVELVPLIFASMLPMGLVSDEVFEFMMGEMVSLLMAHAPWDVVLLDLHGAGVSESHDDMDGEILHIVRQAVGEQTILATTLDMHANVSPQMVQEADVVNLYTTNPHLDTKVRALQCANLAFRVARGESHPVAHLIQLPLVINILRQSTSDEPLASILKTLAEVEAMDGTLSASFGLGYPYSDSPKMGSTVLVVDDGDFSRARERALLVAQHAWAERSELQGNAPTPEQAALLVANDPGPTVLLDVGDNVGGGTEGDSTILLRALVEAGVENVFVVLCDPTAAITCHSVGTDSNVTLEVGGRSGEEIGPPIEISGTVIKLSDGRFEQPRPSHGGRPHQDVGPTAVIESDRIGKVMITSRPFMPFSTEPYEALGIDISESKVIIAKGVIAPRAGLAPVTSTFHLVDTPGPTAANFQQFTFSRRRHPIYPFEKDLSIDDAIHTDGVRPRG